MIILIIGYFIGYLYSSAIPNKHKIKDAKHILKSLISNQNIDIQKENIHCEIVNDHNNTLTQVKVSDFLQNYLSISIFNRTKTFHDNIECGAKGKGICSLSYGDKEEVNKGWSRSLFFEYDSKNKFINPKSFECIDIP